jgi:hypothetical protein
MASSGLPVTFAFTGPATLAGNALTPTSPGKVTVTAFQDGDQNHFPAAPVVRTFCMLPPKPLVSTAQSMVGVLLTSSGAEGNQWLQNGEPVDGATSTTYQVTGPGSFSVKVSIGGCENVSEVVTLTADEKSFTSRKRFRVFPNPTPNQVTVAYAAPHWAEPPKLIVYSVVGKRIQEHILAWHGELWEVNVRLDGYQAGLYLFSLVEADNQVIQTRRVMKY